eukprot:82947-Chlamydomonas_euryale.AAC.5
MHQHNACNTAAAVHEHVLKRESAHLLRCCVRDEQRGPPMTGTFNARGWCATAVACRWQDLPHLHIQLCATSNQCACLCASATDQGCSADRGGEYDELPHCPATGQGAVSSKCPATGQGAVSSKCPATGQRAVPSNTADALPLPNIHHASPSLSCLLLKLPRSQRPGGDA